MTRRIDPISLATLAAIAGIVGGGLAAVDFIDRHFPRYASKKYQKLSRDLSFLSDELAYLLKDIDILQGILVGAKYNGGDRSVRMDNGAFLTVGEFMKLERVSDAARQVAADQQTYTQGGAVGVRARTERHSSSSSSSKFGSREAGPALAI